MGVGRAKGKDKAELAAQQQSPARCLILLLTVLAAFFLTSLLQPISALKKSMQHPQSLQMQFILNAKSSGVQTLMKALRMKWLSPLSQPASAKRARTVRLSQQPLILRLLLLQALPLLKSFNANDDKDFDDIVSFFKKIISHTYNESQGDMPWDFCIFISFVRFLSE